MTNKEKAMLGLGAVALLLLGGSGGYAAGGGDLIDPWPDDDDDEGGGASGGGGTDSLGGTPTGPKKGVVQQTEYPRPPGNPPGGCHKHYDEAGAEAVLQALGYNPKPGVFGPDGQLGTYDAEPDPEIARFQNQYNGASGRGALGPNAGGLGVDGWMGKCTMAGMKHVYEYVGAAAWKG